jgi:hypothetical protein
LRRSGKMGRRSMSKMVGNRSFHNCRRRSREVMDL